MFSLLSSIAIFFFLFYDLFISFTLFVSFYLLAALPSCMFCVFCSICGLALLMLLQNDFFFSVSSLNFTSYNFTISCCPAVFLDSSTRFVVFIFGFALLIILSCWNIGIIFICRGSSLVAQLIKNPPATWETWVQSLGWEDPLKGYALQCSGLESSMDSPWGCKESDTTESFSRHFNPLFHM